MISRITNDIDNFIFSVSDLHSLYSFLIPFKPNIIKRYSFNKFGVTLNGSKFNILRDFIILLSPFLSFPVSNLLILSLPNPILYDEHPMNSLLIVCKQHLRDDFYDLSSIPSNIDTTDIPLAKPIIPVYALPTDNYSLPLALTQLIP
jgi:hypothetical protein